MKIGKRVGTGIVVIIAIMLTLTIAGINYMFQVNMRMKDIVENINVKTEMAHVMQNTLRERSLSMFYMIIVDDDFLRDEEWQRFNNWAAEYYHARVKMESLVTTDEEKEIMSQISMLTNNTRPDVDRVMERLLVDDPQQHYDAIRDRLLPKQKQIHEQVAKLVALQKTQAAAAIKQAELSYEYARNLMWFSGALAFMLVILIAAMVSRKVSKQALEMEYLAFHDELTDLPNRSLFLDRLTHAIAYSKREGVSFAIILLDLDRFKEVNDTLGHNVGDQLLQCAEFIKMGVDVTVAVNLSARSLHDLRLPGEVARMLANAAIKSSMLVLEITESAVMSDPAEALEVLQMLDKMGVLLSIDDFGTGYSSLAYLTKLPIDEIKIDKSFVLSMVRDQQAAVIVHSTIELGHSLGKKVVAEGVETHEMWDQLLAWGCDTAQGYYMSKPLPADQLKRWLRESKWNAST